MAFRSFQELLLRTGEFAELSGDLIVNNKLHIYDTCTALCSVDVPVTLMQAASCNRPAFGFSAGRIGCGVRTKESSAGRSHVAERKNEECARRMPLQI